MLSTSLTILLLILGYMLRKIKSINSSLIEFNDGHWAFVLLILIVLVAVVVVYIIVKSNDNKIASLESQTNNLQNKCDDLFEKMEKNSSDS